MMKATVWDVLKKLHLTKMDCRKRGSLKIKDISTGIAKDCPCFGLTGLQTDSLSFRLNAVGKLSIAIVFIFFSGIAFSADTSVTLSVQVRGFTHQRGHVVANLFRDGDDVLKPDKAYRRAQAEIRDGLATIDIPELAYGKYAVSVFHDENDNGTLDHNFFRFPAEPLGFSNHFHLGLFSGMPSFEKIQFQFTADTRAVEITVK